MDGRFNFRRVFFTADLPTPDKGKSGDLRKKFGRFYKK